MNASGNSFARASRADGAGARVARVSALVLALALSACSRGAAPMEEPSAPIDAATIATAAPVIDAAAKLDEKRSREDAATGDALAAFATAAPLAGKSIGHTSVVFKLKLEGGVEAAYKPRSKRGPTRYRGEVAAYRLATALGLDNVPPAIARSFDRSALAAALGSEPLFESEVIAGPDGKVRGALIPWIKGLELLDLERDPWLSRWHGWLARGGALGDDAQGLATQISTMVVFDYLTGNWDRWSGGNVGTDRAKTRVLYIDNDGAFYDPPPAAALARQLAILRKVDRYSRRFVAALRTVSVGDAIGEEVPGEPLLSKRIVASVEERKKTALGIVDAKIAAMGEKEVFAFE